MVAVLSGIASWFWLMSDIAMPSAAESGDWAVSDLAEVGDQDVADALTTIDGSSAFRAKFTDGKNGCRQKLAWVSLVSAPGQPPARLRIKSGEYYSPIFTVSAAPVRVAIPYPGPYETGHGKLTAIDTGGSVMIALRPAWQVPAKDGQATRDVTWQAGKRCGPPNG
jgi:hypothetical protein